MTIYNILVPLVSGFRPLDELWVPLGSEFRVGTQKVGSSGFRVPTKFFFVPTPGLDCRKGLVSLIWFFCLLDKFFWA